MPCPRIPASPSPMAAKGSPEAVSAVAERGARGPMNNSGLVIMVCVAPLSKMMVG